MATVKREFFIAQFREEAKDHIQRITQKLLHLEEHPGEQKQHIDEVFRIAHTLKGSSRMMGCADISTLAHKMEDLFVEVRDGHLTLQATVTDLLFYCLDTITHLIEGLSAGLSRTTDIEHLVDLFDNLLAGKRIQVPYVHPHIPRPSESGMSAGASPVKAEESPGESEERQYVRIHTKALDTMLNLAGEILTNQYRYDGQIIALHEIVQELQRYRDDVAAVQEIVHSGKSTDSLSQLHDISEQLTQHSFQMVRKIKALLKKIRTDRQQMHQAMNNLQDHVIDIRMVPAARIFHLLPGLVRMTAKHLGKAVVLNIHGEDTRIDSRIIEEIRDPLIHLIQNAIRHGIESPEERQQQGKDPTGTILLSASQEGNRVVIRVRDDGKGIDLERIKEAAVTSGLLSRDDLQTINDQELHEFLFQSGFSTADTVDDIAGRGIGLDIVRDHVDRVQGEIEVHSHIGQGTEFVLKLPLTLAMMNALLVRVADQIFAIPTTAIEKTFDIRPEDIDQHGKIPAVMTDGALLPVVELQRILQFSNRHTIHKFSVVPPFIHGEELPLQTVIVIRSEEHRIGFIVDDLVEEREIVIKHLGSCLKRVRNVAGATILQEDTVIILFVRDILHTADALVAEMTAQATLLETPTSDRKPTTLEHPAPRILVIDDSPNAREIERTVLEHAGYRVETAVNGTEGLDTLRRVPCNLVVTDIEMPEMNGLQLLRHIQDDEVLCHIPVVVVSARKTVEEQQESLHAGAAAHIVKDEFDEHTFLDVVQACLKMS